MSFTPYEPPAAARDVRPAVITWYRVYAGAMAVLSLALSAVSMVSGGPAPILLVVSAALMAGFFAVAALVPFKPWGWTLALVAIALGLAGVTVLVAAPLLFMWWRPTVKAAFARL